MHMVEIVRVSKFYPVDVGCFRACTQLVHNIGGYYGGKTLVAYLGSMLAERANGVVQDSTTPTEVGLPGFNREAHIFVPPSLSPFKTTPLAQVQSITAKPVKPLGVYGLCRTAPSGTAARKERSTCSPACSSVLTLTVRRLKHQVNALQV